MFSNFMQAVQSQPAGNIYTVEIGKSNKTVFSFWEVLLNNYQQ